MPKKQQRLSWRPPASMPHAARVAAHNELVRSLVNLGAELVRTQFSGGPVFAYEVRWNPALPAVEVQQAFRAAVVNRLPEGNAC